LFWTYENGQQHWSIVSDKAEYNSDTSVIGLYENLTAKTVNDESQILFNAKNLLVDLNTKIANTSDGITLNKQQLTMTGQIAKFDLTNETIEVNNNVKAVYKTNNHNTKK
jgi:LPS export ABC transporter protein LptC